MFLPGSRLGEGTLTLHLPPGIDPRLAVHVHPASRASDFFSIGPFTGGSSSSLFPIQPDGLEHLEVRFNPSSFVLRVTL